MSGQEAAVNVSTARGSHTVMQLFAEHGMDGRGREKDRLEYLSKISAGQREREREGQQHSMMGAELCYKAQHSFLQLKANCSSIHQAAKFFTPHRPLLSCEGTPISFASFLSRRQRSHRLPVFSSFGGGGPIMALIAAADAGAGDLVA